MVEQSKEFAKEIFEQINIIRKDPKSIIPFLEESLKNFEGDALYMPHYVNGGLAFDEGQKGYKEAIEFLKKAKPLKPFEWSDELRQAAEDHVSDIGPKGLLSHTGSNKTTYKERIEKYCKWGGSIFEAIHYGPKEQARDVVVSWLVDDGVPKRTHRINILGNDLKLCGIASGDHSQAMHCNVAVFAVQAVSHKKYQEEYIDQAALHQEKLKNMDWMKLAREVFELQNKVRQNPKFLIPQLDRALMRFKGKVLMSEDGKSGHETQEGNFAYVEAIEFLEIQRPMPPLQWSQQLMRAAYDHINDIGPKGMNSSIGTDGSLPTDRLGRYCNIDDAWAESMAFQALTARDVVERLIVDDGQPARGQRKNMFNLDMKNCGIAAGPHSGLESVILIDYASAILKDGEMPTINVQVQEEVPEELIEKMAAMGIDVSKIKVKKDTKDAKTKAMQLFKKATSAVKVGNKLKSLSNPQQQFVQDNQTDEQKAQLAAVQEEKKEKQTLVKQMTKQTTLVDTVSKALTKKTNAALENSSSRPSTAAQKRPDPKVGVQSQRTSTASTGGQRLIGAAAASINKQLTNPSAPTKQISLGGTTATSSKNTFSSKNSLSSKNSSLSREQVSPFKKALEEKKEITKNNAGSSLGFNSMSPQKQSPPTTQNTKQNLDKLKNKVNMMAKPAAKIAAGAKKTTNATVVNKQPTKKQIEVEMTEEEKTNNEFDLENDPDKPIDAVQSNIIIEEIEMNGKKQKVIKKTYQLVDGRTVAITKMQQM